MCLETLFGALSRLLREEGTKDLELGSTILLIFFSFSNFSQFHPFLSQNSVGSICLKIILVEIERRNKVFIITNTELKCTDPQWNEWIQQTSSSSACFETKTRAHAFRFESVSTLIMTINSLFPPAAEFGWRCVGWKEDEEAQHCTVPAASAGMGSQLGTRVDHSHLLEEAQYI
jgi:hypothetical protein